MNLGGGVKHRLKKLFSNPYDVFDISIGKQKLLKHQTDLEQLKFHTYRGKYEVVFKDSLTFLMSINELFIQEFYKFSTQNPQPRIIDCGSYIGTSLLYFKTHYPGAIITGFEPDNKNFALLKQNTDNWKFENVSIYNAAIWINNGTINFNSEGNMSSRIEEDTPEANDSGVTCFRLKDMLNETVDFLKVDIESAEYVVLKDCRDQLRNVKNLFVEYHGVYNESYKLNEILDILLENDFQYYIKEGTTIYNSPFFDKRRNGDYDIILNIFAFRR